MIPVHVTPDDIGWVEQQLKPRASGGQVSFRDDERKAALVCPSTRDISACAGSGKTTLLAAKLAILVNKWPYAHRGVAVLSHTNNALNIIATALPSRTEVRVRSYPHFIGTIQSFVDRFLAAPVCVQRFGARPMPCEPAEFGRLCVAEAYKGGYSNVLTRLKTRQQQEPEDYLSKMIYLPASDQLDGDALGLKDRERPTFRELAALKSAMSRTGRFTFGDMLSLAELALAELPFLVRCLQQRFPVVLFDEAQDTSPRVESLFSSMFADGSVVQRFGDPNQAIYSSNRECSESPISGFPGTDALPMSESTRLSPDTAALVGHVTVSDYCIVSGRSGCQRRPHTVFIFTPSTIKNVLPAFRDLVLSAFDQSQLDDGRVVALGGVQKPEEADGHRRLRGPRKTPEGLPKSLCDYWDGFVPKQKQPRTKLACLADYLSAGISESTACGRAGPLWTHAQRGIARLARICGCTVTSKKQDATATDLLLFLERERGEFFRWMRRQLYRLWRERRQPDEALMTRYSQALGGIVGRSGACRWNSEAERFVNMASVTAPPPKAIAERPSPDNVYTDPDPRGRSVSIEVRTIHAEKGFEHLATLVLETRYREHDLLAALPFLLGRTGVPSSSLRKGHIRKVHVAMTRPRELLCLAISSSHLTEEQREQLKSRGWDVKLV